MGQTLSQMFGDGWTQLGQLGLAFVLSSIVGLEREIKLKAAGMRTHALVGMGSALLMLVSKWGFSDALGASGVSLDPSRVAAQIVSGIGFIGAGLIFVRKDIVHGLTTAATIWVTAGIGMACGGGLYYLAIAASVCHFLVVFVYTWVMRWFLGSAHFIHIRYIVGHDVAAKVIDLCSSHDFTIRKFTVKDEYPERNQASMYVQLQGAKLMAPLAEKLAEVENIVSVNFKRSHED